MWKERCSQSDTFYDTSFGLYSIPLDFLLSKAPRHFSNATTLRYVTIHELPNVRTNLLLAETFLKSIEFHVKHRLEPDLVGWALS